MCDDGAGRINANAIYYSMLQRYYWEKGQGELQAMGGDRRDERCTRAQTLLVTFSGAQLRPAPRG
eukprot:4895975-Pyramimonas_sp.AAC.1